MCSGRVSSACSIPYYNLAPHPKKIRYHGQFSQFNIKPVEESMVINTTFNNISDLLVKETVYPAKTIDLP
jgi:hypothetical protein